MLIALGALALVARPLFDVDLAPANDPYFASLIAGVTTPPPGERATIELTAPEDDAGSTTPPTLRWRDPSAPESARYTAHLVLPSGLGLGAYESAGIGPGDLDLVELHDASAPSEVIAYDYLGLCEKGQGGRLIEDGSTRLGGRIPVNVSGGLLRKGHPIGASGAAQIVEIAEQLMGRSNQRQVADARIGLAHNGGGLIGLDAAATVVSILARED